MHAMERVGQQVAAGVWGCNPNMTRANWCNCQQAACHACALFLHNAEDDKIMQAAEDAKRKKKKQDLADAAREPEADSQWGSVPGGMQALEAKKKSKKAFFADHQGDATVEVATRMGPGGKVGSPLSQNVADLLDNASTRCRYQLKVLSFHLHSSVPSS